MIGEDGRHTVIPIAMAPTLWLDLVAAICSTLHYSSHLVHRFWGSDCDWRDWNIEIVRSHIDGLVERSILEGN